MSIVSAEVKRCRVLMRRVARAVCCYGNIHGFQGLLEVGDVSCHGNMPSLSSAHVSLSISNLIIATLSVSAGVKLI